MSAVQMMRNPDGMPHPITPICYIAGCVRIDPAPSPRPSALAAVAFGIGVGAVVVAAVLGIGWLYGRALERDLLHGDGG